VKKIVYDVETQIFADELKDGWNDVFGMKISSCVCYCYDDNAYHFFGDTVEEHKNLLKFMSGNLAITFNGINFDSRVLLGNDRIIKSNGYTEGSPFGEKIGFHNYDISAEIWRSFFDDDNIVNVLKQQGNAKYLHVRGVWNLDVISRNTLGNQFTKLGNGSQAPQKYKDGRMRELWQYNLQDVRVEKALFEFVKKYKYIVNGEYDIIKLK